jgi:hypothetical protein
MQMNENDNMQEHINRMTGIAEQLEGMGAGINDSDLAMILLASIPDSYETLIVTLKSRIKELTSNFVKARLLQEEIRQNDGTRHDSNETVLYTNKRDDKKNKPNYDCFHC